MLWHVYCTFWQITRSKKSSLHYQLLHLTYCLNSSCLMPISKFPLQQRGVRAYIVLLTYFERDVFIKEGKGWGACRHPNRVS